MAQQVEQINSTEQSIQTLPKIEIIPDSEGKMNHVCVDGDASFPSVDGYIQSGQLEAGTAIAEGGLFALSDTDIFADKNITASNLAQESNPYKIAARFEKDSKKGGAGAAVYATPAGYVYATSPESGKSIAHISETGSMLLGDEAQRAGVVVPLEGDRLVIADTAVAETLAHYPERFNDVIDMVNSAELPYFVVETSAPLADAMQLEADRRQKARNLKQAESRGRTTSAKKSVQTEAPIPATAADEQKTDTSATEGEGVPVTETAHPKPTKPSHENWQRAIPTLENRRPREHGPKDNISLRTEAMEEYQDKLDRERGFRIIDRRKIGRAALDVQSKTTIKLTENGVDLDTEQRPEEGRPEAAPVIDPAVEAAEYKLMVLEETIKEIRRRKLKQKWIDKYQAEYDVQLKKLKALRHETDDQPTEVIPAVTPESQSNDTTETETTPTKSLWRRMEDRVDDMLAKASAHANSTLFFIGSRIRKPEQKTTESENEYNERIRKRGAVITAGLGIVATAATAWALTSGDNETAQGITATSPAAAGGGEAAKAAAETAALTESVDIAAHAEALKQSEVGAVSAGEGLLETFTEMQITDPNEQYALLHNNQLMLELRDANFTYLGSDGWRIKMPEGGRTPDEVLKILAKYTHQNQ